MAKKYSNEEGVWRTIGGRRVFIKTGQSLSDAMKDSGKFKARMNEKAVKGAREENLKEQYMTSLNNVSKMEYDGEITKDEYDEAIKNINKTYKEKKLGEDKFYTRKDGTKEYDPYKGTKFEKKYDSVEDRYNNDKDFRKMLEGEHQKTLDTTRKEINSYFDMTLEDRKRLVGNEDDLYKALNEDYGNIDREDFDKLYKEELGKRVGRETAKKFGAKDVKINGEKIDLEKERYKELTTMVQKGKVLPYSDEEKEYAKLRKIYGRDKMKLDSQYTADERDILDRFGEDYGYDKGDKLDNLVDQIDYMRNPNDSIHKTAERFVEGGGFLIYNGDIQDYLKERNIKFNDDNFFDIYKKDMADKIEKLYNEGVSSNLKVRFKDTYKDIKETTDMSEAEILELLKKIAERTK